MLKKFAPQLVAAAVIGFVAYQNVPRSLGAGEIQHLAEKYAFDKFHFSETYDPTKHRQSRLFRKEMVHLEHYLGAFLPTGAVLTDLDGNGLADEACVTNPFSREVSLLSGIGQANGQTVALKMPALEGRTDNFFPTGCLPVDLTRDGRKDLIVYFWGRSPVLFTMSEDHQFRAREVVTPVETWYTQSIAVGDMNGNGRLDLVIANYYPEEANLLANASGGNNYFMHKGFGASDNGGVNYLAVNTTANFEEPTFQVDKQIFADQGGQWTMGLAVADLSGDALPEIVFINDHGTDRVLFNASSSNSLKFNSLRGNNHSVFTPPSFVIGEDQFHGMGIDVADYNNDGNLDIAVPNFCGEWFFCQSNYMWLGTGQNDLYSKNQAPFLDHGQRANIAQTKGVPWDTRSFDLDNDGNREIFMSIGMVRGKIDRIPEFFEFAMMNDIVMPYTIGWQKFDDDADISGRYANALFTKTKHGWYQDIGTELNFKEASLSRGISAGDVDGDGKVDLLLSHNHGGAVLYKNKNSNSNGYLVLDMRIPYGSANVDKVVVSQGRPEAIGPAYRRPIGATITVELDNGKKMKSFVDGGSGVGGKQGSELHFGIGSAKVKASTVVWRDLKGNVHSKSFDVVPGWNTVWLGGPDNYAETR